ncbi:uncharacterized protein LOC118428265 [Branchiostoma floridae]|uniref:Uncharacterized protein LOC118428265 n=1 Tax=Branchiostoma floridae TaxID=7739 RepID=C3ZDS8_BRAFL|nr:uncharacterized protein LOC118428265 [Branchiostoma floridae]|eukprot:XP_002592873.1 hypothetical protein BRAFLDRAFT_117740 [Branchiostoma floridae]
MTPFLLLLVALATASPVKRQTGGVLDADGDGHLTIIEIENAMDLGEVLVALDTDNDQHFTVDEALQFIDHHYFNRLDTNHDHRLSFAELQNGLTLADLFAFYDRNGDGFLYGDEDDRIYALYNAAYGSSLFQTGGVLDADGDGHLTIIEIENAMDLVEVLVALDTDNDQHFTVDQALQFIDHHYFNRLDTNHDHRLSFAELQTGLTLADLFAFYDRNGDGFLYGDEDDRIYAMYNAAYGPSVFQAGPSVFQTGGVLDADGDGHLTIIEIENAMDLGEVLVALDTDNDQMFTVDEALQFIDHHYFNRLDTNHDHRLSFAELQNGLTLADLFAFYDRNGDGFLYGDEDDRIYALYNAAYGSS